MPQHNLFSSHQFLDFAESYQCGCVWTAGLGATDEVLTDDSASATTWLLLSVSTNCGISETAQRGEEADFSVWVSWQIPEAIHQAACVVKFDEADGEETAKDNNETDVFVLPSLPVEYIKSVVVSKQRDKDALERSFENLHQGQIPFEVLIDEQIVSNRLPVSGLMQNRSMLSPDELRKINAHWDRSARLSRMLALGLLQYRREGDGFETNFDLSTHRANAFMQGVKKPADAKKRSLYAIDQKMGRKATEVLGRSLKLSTIREPGHYSMDDLLEVAQMEVAQNECRQADLISRDLVEPGDDPDKYLFRQVVNHLATSPLTPQLAGEWFAEMIRLVEKKFAKTDSKEDKKTALAENYVREAKKLLADGSRVSLPAFIARAGDRSPMLVALAIIFKSDRFDDADRLSERMDSLNVNLPLVRWLVWVLFGIQNGYKSILYYKYQKKEAFRESFLAAFELLAVGEKLASDDFLSEPNLKIHDLHASKDRNGADRISGRLGRFQELEIRVSDPDSGLAERFFRLMSSANDDEVLRKRILREFESLGMSTLPIVREHMTLEVSSRGRRARFVTENMVASFTGGWELGWTCEEADWKRLSEELDRKLLKKHIHDHNGAFKKVVGSLEKRR
jgi:hypothetical protein